MSFQSIVVPLINFTPRFVSNNTIYKDLNIKIIINAFIHCEKFHIKLSSHVNPLISIEGVKEIKFTYCTYIYYRLLNK